MGRQSQDDSKPHAQQAHHVTYSPNLPIPYAIVRDAGTDASGIEKGKPCRRAGLWAGRADPRPTHCLCARRGGLREEGRG